MCAHVCVRESEYVCERERELESIYMVTVLFEKHEFMNFNIFLLMIEFTTW